MNKVSLLSTFAQRAAIDSHLLCHPRNKQEDVIVAKALVECGPPWFPLSLRHIKQTRAICDGLEETWQESRLFDCQTTVRLGALDCNLG